MLLLDRTGAKQDVFSRVETAEDAAGKIVLAPFAQVVAALAAGPAQLGVDLPNNVKADEVEPWFDHLALIAIAFPSGTDGRGFSLARQLRQRGFTGVLRATGPLFSDQFPQALACGFDEVEIPDANALRQPVEQWLAALERISLAYQRNTRQGQSILALRSNGAPHV